MVLILCQMPQPRPIATRQVMAVVIFMVLRTHIWTVSSEMLGSQFSNTPGMMNPMSSDRTVDMPNSTAMAPTSLLRLKQMPHSRKYMKLEKKPITLGMKTLEGLRFITDSLLISASPSRNFA